jgi:hypothetical protein
VTAHHDFDGATCTLCHEVDLSGAMSGLEIDAVMASIERVIAGAESLSLDSADDRATLIERLKIALLGERPCGRDKTDPQRKLFPVAPSDPEGP